MNRCRGNPKRKFNGIFHEIVWLSTLVITSLSVRVLAAPTTVQVDPPSSNVAVLATFNINITVTDVQNLTGWEFKLFYKNAVLNCTGVTQGPFLMTGGSTFMTKQINNNYNSTHGRILAGCALLGQNVSANGSGTLTTVTFRAVGGGDSVLDLVDTKLSDEKIPPQPIPHSAVDGTVHVTGTVVRDVALINVTPHKTVVAQGYFCNLTITVENQGALDETFNVTIYANTTEIGKVEVNLAIGGITTVKFAWNTSSFGRAQNISAYAGPVPGETELSDNNFVYGIVKVTCLGDINGDYVTDAKDFQLVKLAIPSMPGSPKWKPNADMNDDLVIDSKDYQIVKRHIPSIFP